MRRLRKLQLKTEKRIKELDAKKRTQSARDTRRLAKTEGLVLAQEARAEAKLQ
jgi:hypothetical protein